MKDFSDLESLAAGGSPRPVVVAMAEEGNALSAIMQARERGVVEPVLVGRTRAIEAVAEEEGVALSGVKIHEADGEEEAVRGAVALVRGGGGCLMKGKSSTRALLKGVLARESGIRGDGLLSHVAAVAPLGYHKMLFLTDPAINIAPDIETKVGIIKNAIRFVSSLGILKPKVALICAVERVNPAMPATTDADTITRMAQRGEIQGGVIEGPLALDNALSKESCITKGIAGEVGGDADILVVPTVEAGNVLYKALACLTDSPMAGVVVGAEHPIIMTSRADSDQTKYLSILLGVSVIQSPQP